MVLEEKICALYLAWWPIGHEVGSSGTSQLKTLPLSRKREMHQKIGNPTKEGFCLLFLFQVGICCVYLGPSGTSQLKFLIASIAEKRDAATKSERQ